MPHFGSRVIDDRGVSLVREWILQLDQSSEPANEDDDASSLARQLAASNQATLKDLIEDPNANSSETPAAIDRLL